MGSGKGNPEFWVAVIKPGRIMFEMGGVSEAIARQAMRLAAQKMPIKVKFVSAKDLGPITAAPTTAAADAAPELVATQSEGGV
jgi:large subunit ribosomal protein L16